LLKCQIPRVNMAVCQHKWCTSCGDARYDDHSPDDNSCPGCGHTFHTTERRAETPLGLCCTKCGMLVHSNGGVSPRGAYTPMYKGDGRNRPWYMRKGGKGAKGKMDERTVLRALAGNPGSKVYPFSAASTPDTDGDVNFCPSCGEEWADALRSGPASSMHFEEFLDFPARLGKERGRKGYRKGADGADDLLLPAGKGKANGLDGPGVAAFPAGKGKGRGRKGHRKGFEDAGHLGSLCRSNVTYFHLCRWCFQEIRDNCPNCRREPWQFYCQRCLLGRSGPDEEQRQVVANVFLEDAPDFPGKMEVTCMSLAGTEILRKIMSKDTTVQALRSQVQAAVGAGAEKRLARDGKFYTEARFLAFYKESGPLSWAAAPARIEVKLLADGKILSDGMALRPDQGRAA